MNVIVVSFGAITSMLGWQLSDDDVVSLAVRGNQASIDAIGNYHAKVEWTVTAGGKAGSVRGECWRTQSAVRLKELQDDRVIDELNESGKVSIVVSNVDADGVSSKGSSMIVGEPSRRAVDANAWELSLFTLPVGIHRQPPYSAYTLGDAVAKGRTQGSWVTEGGRKLIKLTIDLDDERRSYDLRLDPETNYMIRSCTHVVRDESSRETWRNVYEVQEFQEIQPSLFVPRRMHASMRFQNDLTIDGLAIFSDVTVNAPGMTLPGMPKVGQGGSIFDEVAGVMRFAGSNGEPRGRAVRIGQSDSPPIPAAPEAQSPETLGAVGWLFLVSSALLTGVMAYRLIATIRSTRA